MCLRAGEARSLKEHYAIITNLRFTVRERTLGNDAQLSHASETMAQFAEASPQFGTARGGLSPECGLVQEQTIL